MGTSKNWPSLGEASRDYHLPPQQATASKTATEQAKKQRDLADLFQTDGWTGTKEKTLKHLKPKTHIPSSYTKTDTWVLHYTTAIDRNPDEYRHLFDEAEHTATMMKLHLQLTYDQITPKQEALIHCRAIQQAITHIRPGQEKAEKNMENLTQKTLDKEENIIQTKAVKDAEAEVCTLKSAIAQWYLEKNCPHLHTTMKISESDDWKSWHAYLELSGVITTPFHPNSPLKTMTWAYLPGFETMSDEQRKFLLTLQQTQKKDMKLVA